MEAARALGMTHLQGLRHVVIPQSFRLVLPPVTNDFISLLKDSSLVSMVTLLDLTAFTTASPRRRSTTSARASSSRCCIS